MYVPVKKTVEEQVKITRIVRNRGGEVVGMFPFGSDAEEFMSKVGYKKGTLEEV